MFYYVLFWSSLQPPPSVFALLLLLFACKAFHSNIPSLFSTAVVAACLALFTLPIRKINCLSIAC